MIATSPLRSDESKVVLTVLPMNMLIGFALELYFKAWLLDAGRPSAKVKALSHEITALHNEARIEGLPLIPLLDQLVEALSPGHEDFTHRYINSGDEVSLIKWPLAFAALQDLDTAVDAKIGASASMRLKPGH